MHGTNWRAIQKMVRGSGPLWESMCEAGYLMFDRAYLAVTTRLQVPTRTLVQIRTHAQKYFIKQGVKPPTSDRASSGQKGAEDDFGTGAYNVESRGCCRPEAAARSLALRDRTIYYFNLIPARVFSFSVVADESSAAAASPQAASATTAVIQKPLVVLRHVCLEPTNLTVRDLRTCRGVVDYVWAAFSHSL